MKRIAFKDVPVGTEFWWGSYTLENSNWGRKRSSRTADWKACLNGKLSSHVDWGYWAADEVVYLAG